MKKLAFILLVLLVGCKYIPNFQGSDIIDEWIEYKEYCYKDSTMVVFDVNSGQLIDSVIVFEKDTIWTHKQPVWMEFLNLKEKQRKEPRVYLFGPSY